MKKMVVYLTLIFSSLSLFGMQKVTAEETSTIRPLNNVITAEKKVESDSKVKLGTGDDNETKPEDPNDPKDPDPGTHQPGPLSLDQVISFAFEEKELYSGTQYASLAKKTPQNIQVTDKRGSGKGWSLQVKQSDLISVNEPNNKLKGAYIDFPKMTVKRGKDLHPEAVPPVAQVVSFNEKNKREFSKILVADVDQGMGTWLGYYNEGNSKQAIALVIPPGGYRGHFKGQVTWLLSEGPIAN